MKKILAAAICLISAATLSAQEKTQIVKTGLSYGPCPAVAFDADKGFQYGGLLNIYNFGDGSSYPNYNSKWYFEASFFTKGSNLFQVMYDNKVLIPGVRWSSAAALAVDKAMDFYGFNGYEADYNWEAVNQGKEDDDCFLYSPYYRISRTSLLLKSDLIGEITSKFKWEAGLHMSYFKTGAIDLDNINKGKAAAKKYPDALSTLYEDYVNAGIIPEDQKDGGWSTTLRAGLTYDSRDKEGAPTKGIWAEGHVTLAPGFLSTKGFARYSLTMRQYFPIIKNDKLTFAYRLNYEGDLGGNSPWYVLPYITVMGENCDKDGMGGYRTVRGILRDRVIGLDMASWTAEMRWRFLAFTLGKQNIALGLSAFSDGATVTKDWKMPELAKYRSKDGIHATIGAGFRFIMNENFIIAAEYGMPTSHLLSKSNPLYNQDGNGAFYINSGYLF